MRGAGLDVGAIQTLLDRRYRRRGAWTVVTSPLTPKQFQKVYGDATVARLKGIGTEVEVNEADARKWLENMKAETA